MGTISTLRLEKVPRSVRTIKKHSGQSPSLSCAYYKIERNLEADCNPQHSETLLAFLKNILEVLKPFTVKTGFL